MGHTATALFLQDGTLANDYLYRNSIAGKPELNRMNTDLSMGANDIGNAKNITATDQIEGETLQSTGRTKVGEYVDIGSEEVEGTACEKTGLVTKNAEGLILSCQSGLWVSAGGVKVILEDKGPGGGTYTYSSSKSTLVTAGGSTYTSGDDAVAYVTVDGVFCARDRGTETPPYPGHAYYASASCSQSSAPGSHTVIVYGTYASYITVLEL